MIQSNVRSTSLIKTSMPIEMRLNTYHTDEWTSVQPAEFPEFHRVVANHFFDTIIESINTKCP